MTPAELDRLELLHMAKVHSTAEEIVAAFPALARALREARAETVRIFEDAIFWKKEANANLADLRKVQDGLAQANSVLEWGPDEELMNWDEAVAFAEGKGEGWRLPTVAELVAQYDYVKGAPADGFRRAWYWSSASDEDMAWLVRFDDGHVVDYFRNIVFGVRLVRGIKS